MKRIGFVLLCFLFILPAFVKSDEKIGYIDSERVINGYKGISMLREQYNKQLSEWEEEARQKKVEIDSLKEELENQDVMLSEETRSRKEEKIREKEKEYKEFLKSIWGEGGESEKKHEELIKPVIEEISNVLEKIGEDEGFTMIFDISKGNIVYAKVGLDLTERVLYEINKEFTVVSPEFEEIDYYVFLFEEISTEAESEAYGRQLKNLISSGLSNFENFEKIEAQRISEILSFQGLVEEDKLDDNEVRTVARRANADIVVFGEVDYKNGRIILRLKWINFEKSNEIIKQEFSIDEKEKLEKMAQDVMTYLGREIKEK
jgi:outer membrane protein